MNHDEWPHNLIEAVEEELASRRECRHQGRPILDRLRNEHHAVLAAWDPLQLRSLLCARVVNPQTDLDTDICLQLNGNLPHQGSEAERCHKAVEIGRLRRAALDDLARLYILFASHDLLRDVREAHEDARP